MFWGFKILYFKVSKSANLLFIKMNIFGGHEDLWILIGVITKMDYFVGTFLGILGHGTTWEYFVCGCYCFC